MQCPLSVVRIKTQTNGQWTEKERVKCFEKNLKKDTFQPQRVNRYVKPQGKPARWGTEWMLSYPNMVKKKKKTKCLLPPTICHLLSSEYCLQLHPFPCRTLEGGRAEYTGYKVEAGKPKGFPLELQVGGGEKLLIE